MAPQGIRCRESAKSLHVTSPSVPMTAQENDKHGYAGLDHLQPDVGFGRESRFVEAAGS